MTDRPARADQLTEQERSAGALDRLVADYPVRLLPAAPRVTDGQAAAFILAAQRATFALATEPASRYAVDNKTT